MGEGTGFKPGDRVLMKQWGKAPFGGRVVERYQNDSGITMLTIERMGYGPIQFDVREDECCALESRVNQQPEAES